MSSETKAILLFILGFVPQIVWSIVSFRNWLASERAGATEDEMLRLRKKGRKISIIIVINAIFWALLLSQI